MPHEHAVNIYFGILFGKGENFQITETGLQSHTHYLLLASQVDYARIGGIHGSLHPVGMSSLLHGSRKQSVLCRYLFIVNVDIRRSWFGAHDEQLRTGVHRNLPGPIVDPDFHLINRSFVDDIRIEIVTQHPELIMHNGDSPCPTRDIEPDFPGLRQK